MPSTISKLSLVWLAAVWWIAGPVVEAAYYSTELKRGAYPTDADSIGIPIVAYTIGWLTATPLVAGLVWGMLWRAPSLVPWAAFDRRRPLWCSAWTAAFGTWACHQLWFAAVSASHRHPEVVIHALLGATVAAGLRAAACTSRADLVSEARV